MIAAIQTVRKFGLAAFLATLCLGLFLTARAGPSAADVAVRELVAFNQGQFPESLTVAPDGTILVGILSTGEIMRITPNGSTSRLAKVPLPQGAFLAGIVALDSTNVYALVFSNDDKNGVWYVSQHGMSVAQIAKLPIGSFPNDLIFDNAGRMLVTDTIGGRVFRVQKSGTFETWVKDPLLLGNVGAPGPFGFPLGANGIALSPAKDAVYVAVTEKARIVRIPIRADGSAGPVTVVAQNPLLEGADGIDIGPNGTVDVAVNGQNQIVAVNPATGSVDVVASGPAFHFPSSVRFTPDLKRAYATNFEGLVLFNLAPGPARPGLLVLDAAGLVPQALTPAAGAPTTVTILPPSTGSAGLADPRFGDGCEEWP